MKNNLFNGNLFKISFLTLTIIFLLFYGCKKDKAKLTDTELTQQAKEWFQAQSSIPYSPSWDKAIVTHFVNNNFIILPSNISLSDGATPIQSFLVVNISENEIKGNIVELFNVKSSGTISENEIISNYLSQGDKSIYTSDLAFNVLAFDVAHKFIKGSSVVDGKISNNLNLITHNDLKSKMLMGGADVGSGKLQCTDWSLVTRVNGKEIGSSYLYTTCTGGAGGGGGSGGGGGGNSTSTKKEVINNITDPCLKTTINEALASNKDVKGFLSEVINKFSGRDNGIKILLYNGDIVNPAKTDPSFGSDGKFTAAITFQNGFYDNVSKEAVVAALIHEVVHAYLLKTNETYKALPTEAQHNFMFTNFVKDIAGYLKSKYNMPNTDAWGLAWSDMGDVINKANDDTTFPTELGETMTKSELATSMAPYKYIDKNAGAKGTPNCPNK